MSKKNILFQQTDQTNLFWQWSYYILRWAMCTDDISNKGN